MDTKNTEPSIGTSGPANPSKFSALMPILGSLGAAFAMALVHKLVAPKSGASAPAFKPPSVK